MSKEFKGTIHLVSTVPIGNIFRRIIDRIFRIFKLTPLHRWGNDLLIPWRYPTRSPHGSSRNLLHHLRKFGKVRYYSLYEKGTIKLGPDDIFIGQPFPDKGFSREGLSVTDDPTSITSSTIRSNPHNHRKFIIVPFASSERLMSWAKDISKASDGVVLIGATWWAKDWDKTPFREIDRTKVLPIDNAVDASEYVPVKKKFNPPGKRKFLYTGHTSWYKNTQQLEAIAEAMPGFEGGHIGLGRVKGWEQICDFTDLTPAFMSKIADEYDIFVNTSSADAQATTIMENMCFGFPIACTKETGYDYPSLVTLSLTDTQANVRALTELNYMSEEDLKKMTDENYRIVKEKHNWNIYVNKVSEFIGLGKKPL